MSHNLQIKEGAFFVTDAHYSHLRPAFLDFLQEIDSKKLQPTQLILMGDIFDALFYEVPYTQKINSEALTLLQKISSSIEVLYLEGNHDFNLKKVFPNMKVFPIGKQPVECEYNAKKVLLAHGDFGSNLSYRVYTAVIRNSFVLRVLNLIDLLLGHKLFKKLDSYLSKKDDCKDFVGFEKFIYNRLANKYSCDYFIEGHFHQNKTFTFDQSTYINLGAFACNQRYFIVKLSQTELLEEKIFSKER